MSFRLNQACVLLILASMLLFSCQKKAPARDPQQEAQADGQGTDDASVGEKKGIDVSLVKLDASGFKDPVVDVKPFHTDAHKKYLADPMKIAPLPDQDLPKGLTAVVGSRVCVLYPNAKLGKAADLADLPNGIPIPFGAIIPIKGDKVSAPEDKEHYGMFQFQENWNWFYRTTYKGKDGLVFGADLYGLDDTNEANRISARLYQTGGKYDEFYPVVGYHELPPRIVARLEKDKLAFQSVSAGEYELRGYRTDLMPDDMLALYSKHSTRYASAPQDWSRKTPIFVTTDLAAHAQHLMFDRTLQFIEEAFFLPRLRILNEAFLADLEARQPNADAYRESIDKAILYFQVAQALLELAPDRSEAKGKYGDMTVSYIDKDKDVVLSAYPAEVREEIAKMDRAGGFENSSVFAFKNGAQAREDYSQYKPRGHYTKNGDLSAYFRAMMWFGRIHFLIAQSGPTPLLSGNGASSDSTALTLAMEPIALLVTDVARKDEKLYKSWCELFDPITALIGLSDDLSFEDVMPLWKDQRVSDKDFGAWISDKENLLAFMQKAHAKLRPPAISGSSVWWGPSEGGDRKPPMGWRLFGQRFTYDSAIHEQVSPPRLMSRDIVRGLDIMKAFGSQTADNLLQASDYPKMDGLKGRLDALEQDFAAYDDDFWQRTYYNNVLFQVKTQAQFEPGAGFYFTESPAWGTKAMLSAHGTWSELRHDTLLYAKQTYAERAGDGDFAPTFRTEEIPEPVHYLEPNLPFWQGSAIAIQKLLKTLDEYGLLDEESAQAFGNLREIYAKAAQIAATEAQDKPVPPADLKWIATIPSELVYLVVVHVEGGDIVDAEQLKMAVVADVFTNAELNVVLETGVGIPYRIYVPLDDGQGGKRIAIGYVFSYYEFTRPIGERMTDETWKGIVYKPGADLDKYRPFWSKGISLPPEPAKSGT
jgi:hypothetical protein